MKVAPRKQEIKTKEPKTQPLLQRRFQIGDKVRILGKSINKDSWTQNRLEQCYPGLIGYVSSISGNPYVLKDMSNYIGVVSNDPEKMKKGGNFFAPEDLELIEPVTDSESKI